MTETLLPHVLLSEIAFFGAFLYLIQKWIRLEGFEEDKYYVPLMAVSTVFVTFFMAVLYYGDPLYFLMAGEQGFPSHHVALIYSVSIGTLYFKHTKLGWSLIIVSTYVYMVRWFTQIHTRFELDAGFVAGLIGFWIAIGVRKYRDEGFKQRANQLYSYVDGIRRKVDFLFR